MKKLKNGSSTEKLEHITSFSTKEKEFSIIWVADAHLDSKKSKKKFLHKVLKDNPEAYIVIGGDSVDVMQGKNDKRSFKGDLDPNLAKRAYFNEVSENIREEFYIPYKDRIIAWNRGNHDNSIIFHNEIDLLEYIVTDGTPINETAGYIIVNCDSEKSVNYVIYYSHIPVSGGKRSKGMLSVDIVRGMYPDADCFITEHIHTNYCTTQKVERVSACNKSLFYKNQYFIQAPSLKDEFEKKRSGYYHERVKAGPQAIGVTKLNFKFNRVHDSVTGKRRFQLNMSPEFIFTE